MKYKKLIIQPAPRFEDETELQTARQALREFVDHPASIALGRKDGMDDNDLAFIPEGMPDGPMVIMDQWLIDAPYLTPRTRLALMSCLSQGAMFAFFNPLAEWKNSLGWGENTARKMLAEMRAVSYTHLTLPTKRIV